MVAVPHATSGLFCDNQPIGAVTKGFFCDGTTIVIPEPIPEPEIISGGGGRGSQQPGYTGQRKADLEQTRRKRILQDDEDVVALIAALLTRDIL